MPRKATSPVEFDQIDRVRTLLRGFRLHPSPDLRVTTASQKTYTGQLVRDHVGNNARKGGRWAYYGALSCSPARARWRSTISTSC